MKPAIDRIVFMYEFLEGLVANYMTFPVKTVTRQVTMRELNLLFESDDFNAYPVEEDARVLGLVTKFDFLSCFAFRPGQMVPRYDELMNRTVADVMTPEFIYVNETTRLTRVLQLIVDHRIKSIPVIKADHQLVGIISREDIMRALARCTDNLNNDGRRVTVL
jgi:CBS domain-containing protein